jgi:hypothetical protein
MGVIPEVYRRHTIMQRDALIQQSLTKGLQGLPDLHAGLIKPCLRPPLAESGNISAWPNQNENGLMAATR